MVFSFFLKEKEIKQGIIYKQFLHGELAVGKMNRAKVKIEVLRLHHEHIRQNDWENLTPDCSSWKKAVPNAKRDFELNRVKHECGRICLRWAGSKNHQ